MGCAASVAGGATSGQNLTRSHVALALNLVAREQLKQYTKSAANNTASTRNSNDDNNDDDDDRTWPTSVDSLYHVCESANINDHFSCPDGSDAHHDTRNRSIHSADPPIDTNEAGPGKLCNSNTPSLQGSSSSSIVCEFNQLQDVHYAERRNYSVSLESLSTEADGSPAVPGEKRITTIHVTEFAPRVFRTLRHMNGVEDDLFADELMLPEEDIVMRKGEGRSQALFLKSKNMLFLCKTIGVDEVHVLLCILRSYTTYIMKNMNSLIMRFYMLLRVSVGKEIGFLLCFGDVYSCAHTINEKWDIKGRMPKPGKFMFFPHTLHPQACGHPYIVTTPTSSGNDSTENELVFGEDTAQMEHRGHEHDEGRSPVAARSEAADDNDDDEGSNTARGATQRTRADQTERRGSLMKSPDELANNAEDHVAIPTRHDKDLTRMFWVKRSLRDRLLRQLDADFDFLHRVNLMDYSLLVGVSYSKMRASCSSRHQLLLYNMLSPQECPPGDAVEIRPSTPHIASRSKRKQHNSGTPHFAEGVRSLHDDEVYFIGIIDILTAYSIKKKSANFFKSILWEQETLSTIPPAEYHARIKKYTHIIFPAVSCSHRN